MYNGALSVAGVVDSDDSSIEITEVIAGTKKNMNDFDSEIVIMKVMKTEKKNTTGNR
jgi:hypothetical protein